MGNEQRPSTLTVSDGWILPQGQGFSAGEVGARQEASRRAQNKPNKLCWAYYLETGAAASTTREPAAWV